MEPTVHIRPTRARDAQHSLSVLGTPRHGIDLASGSSTAPALIKSPFGRAPSAASGAAPARALPNGSFACGSEGGAPRIALSGGESLGRSPDGATKPWLHPAPPSSTR
jgi:hypothetical protein